MTDLPLLISTPDLAELKRIAEAARQGPAGRDGCVTPTHAEFLLSFPPKEVLALIARIEALEAGLSATANALHNAATELHQCGSLRADDYAKQAVEAFAGRAALNPESTK